MSRSYASQTSLVRTGHIFREVSRVRQEVVSCRLSAHALGLAIAVLSVLMQLVLSHPTSAQSFSWATDPVTVERDASLSTNPADYGSYPGCTNKKIFLPNSWGYYQETEYCVYHAKSFEYVFYEGQLFLNLSGSGVFYRVRDWGFSSTRFLIPIQNTDSFIFGSNYFEDVPRHIESNADPYNPGYVTLPNFTYPMASDEKNYTYDAMNTDISNNGRWVIMNVREMGYIRVDTRIMKVKWIARGSDRGEFVAISNDGNTFAKASLDYEPVRIYNLENCGQEADKIQSSWRTSAPINSCPERDLGPEINKALGSDTYTVPAKPTFNDSGTEITLFVRPNHNGGEGIVLKVAGGASGSKLDYLALGDSYSSGEGDLGINEDGWPYYTYASRGIGGCHLSTRSYPFLLSRAKNISDKLMESVACSGARVTKDYHGSSDNYLGQSNQLKGLLLPEVMAARTEALASYRPGVLKQLDFIKATKPKTITLTGGGNDVGFAQILTTCATPLNGTCSYAKKDSPTKQLLADSIRQQYENIKTLITQVREVSPNTTIYYVGYPSFVNDTTMFCKGKAGGLNKDERQMINQAVEYMNMTIKNAAQAAGAHYIDITKSLVGGRLCEGSGQYITNLMDILSEDFEDNLAQTFHPNGSGHRKIADSIIGMNLDFLKGQNPAPDSLVKAPESPIYFAANRKPVWNKTYRSESMIPSIISIKDNVTVKLPIGTFKADTKIEVSLYSKEKKLGKYTVGEDGAVTVTRSLPNDIPSGVHTLLVSGVSPNDELIAWYQFVYIEGNDNSHGQNAVREE